MPLPDLADRARRAGEQARWTESAGYIATGLSEAVRSGRPHEVPDLLNLFGGVAFQRGEMERAERCFQDALGTALRLADVSRQAAALVNLGAIANVRGRFGAALALYRRGQRAYRRAGNAHGEARALHNMGLVLADLKRWRGAQACYRSALRKAVAAGDSMLMGLIALNASEVSIALGDLRAAREACDEACDRLTELEAWPAIADVNMRYGELFRLMDKPGLAREHLRRAARLSHEIGAPLSEAEALRALGQVHADHGAFREALECYGRALRLFRSVEAGHELADTVIVEIVEVYSRDLEAADPFLFGHSARVAQYAAATGRRLGFDPERLKGVLVAGYLHDIGKLFIDREIANKEGPLTPEERASVMRHCAFGADHLSRFELPWNVAPIVRAHHEDYDGSGYPDRLAGEAIPLEARILHVVDVYDALVSRRSWREAWAREEAVAYLRMGTGHSFDPEVLDAFLSVLHASETEAQPAVIVSRPVRIAEAIAALGGRRHGLQRVA